MTRPDTRDGPPAVTPGDRTKNTAASRVSGAHATGAADIPAVAAALIDPAAEVRYRNQLAGEAWRDGYAAAVADLKAAQHDAVRDLGRYLNRWHVCCRTCRRTGHQPGCTRCEARTRATFGREHPDDYPGRDAA